MLERFIHYLKVERRYSAHTLTAYQKDIQVFLDFMAFPSETDITRVHARDVREWIMDLNANGLTNRSINRKISALRAFFKWLKKEGFLKTNPIAKVKGPKTEKRLPHFAKESEMRPMEIISNETDFLTIRNQVIFELFYQTGIRLSELIDLTDSQVQNSYIRVVGKRNKERQIPISSSLYDQICNYQKARSKEGISGIRLLVLKNGKNLYPKLVYRLINLYLSEVTSLEKKSPHVLRHTFATHMLNNGAGLETLKELLGHANLAATQVYTHNSFKQLSNIYSQAHPRGHKTN